VDASGPFGHQTQTVVASVLPNPAAAPARVVSLEAHREIYAGVTSILVSYMAVADGGHVQVIGANGKVLASAPYSPGGTTRLALPVPAPPDDEALETVLTVKRGAAQATASVEIPPAGTLSPALLGALSPAMLHALAAQAAGASQAMVPGATSAGAATALAPAPASDPFAFKARQISGDTFDVTIRRNLPDMHLALQDATGVSLEEHDVPEGAASVTFTAPSVAAAANYFIACTYSRSDSSEETLVRSLRVIPQ
jgi:hypothetical protein